MSERLRNMDRYVLRTQPQGSEGAYLSAQRTVEIAAHTPDSSSERGAQTETARQELTTAREMALIDDPLLALRIDTMLPFLDRMVELPHAIHGGEDSLDPEDVTEIFSSDDVLDQLTTVAAQTLQSLDKAAASVNTFKDKMRRLYGEHIDGRPNPSLYLALQAISERRKKLQIRQISGLLHEQTFLAVMAYEQTDDRITVPSLFLDDVIAHDPSLSHDAVAYDLREHYADLLPVAPFVGVQVKADEAVAISQDYDPSICVITQSDMGNEPGSPLWSAVRSGQYTTLRKIVASRSEAGISNEDHATLISIQRRLLDKIDATGRATLQEEQSENLAAQLPLSA